MSEHVPKPARKYSWPPFEPGHTLSLRHGAYSPRKVDPLAEELAEKAREAALYLSDPGYSAAVWAWARAEARVQLLTEWVDEHGLLDAEGRPRAAADLLIRCERLAAEGRARLGLDPLSRARLGRDVTAARLDLAQVFAGLDSEEVSS